MSIAHIIVELQSLGVRVPKQYEGRRGGAGPAEGQTIFIGNHCCNVPTHAWYVRTSPYHIMRNEGAFILYRNTTPLCPVRFPGRPHYYDINTPDGIPLERIALLHGRDCLASTVYQNCAYWNTVNQCLFCGIGLSLRHGKTVSTKKPEDLALAARIAHNRDGAAHVTLTTGMWDDESKGIEHLGGCVRSIKTATGVPVHVQICPPSRLDILDYLKQVGVDTVGIHIEAASDKVLERVAPAKAAYGRPTFIRCWEYAVAVFGKNQVSSFVIAGLGETPEDIFTTVELLCTIGVFPYVLPLRPIPETPLAGLRPPAPELMHRIYQETVDLLQKYGLASTASKAGCVRCGACSSLALFETIQESENRRQKPEVRRQESKVREQNKK